MIDVKTACEIAYSDWLHGMKFTQIKDAGDSYIICYTTKAGDVIKGNPYRISKEDGSRLPFVFPEKEYGDMFINAKNVDVPDEYAYKEGEI